MYCEVCDAIACDHAEIKRLADNGHVGAQEAWLDLTNPGWDNPTDDYEFDGEIDF